MNKTIKPVERLRGEIDLPGDKSISHRVVFIGSISKGKTTAKNFLNAEDCLHTVSAFCQMGIDIEIKGKNIKIRGNGLKGLKKPASSLYLGNSGTTMRILPGILAGQNFAATLTGDESLSRRPMERIIDPLSKMGVKINAEGTGQTPPIMLRGGSLKPLKYSTQVASAQVKSCILFAGLNASGVTSVIEPFQSRDHTERMLKFWGARIKKRNLEVSVEGNNELSGKDFFVPGDMSSASFFIAASLLLDGSDVTIREVGLNPTRIGFLSVLERMGAQISITNKKEAAEPYGDLRIKSTKLKSTTIKESELPLLIDEVPILSVLAAMTEGQTMIEGISELRVKETDRVRSIITNLKGMGAEIHDEDTKLFIRGKSVRLKGARLSSFGDHRTAMAMSVAALAADRNSEIDETDCINTSFPQFFDILSHLTSK